MDLNPSDPININSNKRLNEGDSTAGFAHRVIKDATVSIPENPLHHNLNSRDAIQNPSKHINLDSATSINLLDKKSLSIFKLVIIIISFLRFAKILDNSNKKVKDDFEKEMQKEKKKMEDGQKKLLEKKKKIEAREKIILKGKEEWEKKTLKEKQLCGPDMLKQLEEWENRVINKGEVWKKRMLRKKAKLEMKMLKNKEEGDKRMLKVIEKFEKKMQKEKESEKSK
ncbi:fam-i protein [Plasmodium gallinaceum]|uniref:Fam-i protein n=1 Tax=Plasmodium gallinaceum TaxID=5849 RepID=A0A1J1GU40_PLAGA|nr:fam-i protein [Plasmodium gallinaceum]CRG96028.1 fam-i protein [Plasmodium gallinaceum]